jgi:hypothetical protein
MLVDRSGLKKAALLFALSNHSAEHAPLALRLVPA